MARRLTPASTHKKAVVLLSDGTRILGYMNPSGLGVSESAELLSREGEFQSVALEKIKSIYFVKEFTEPFEPERKSFFSRPKLDGLWVRLRFRDRDVLEGIVANDLLDLLDHGVRLTPPDLNGNTVWIFIPRAALEEIKVLGVVGAARRQPARAVASAQPRLFEE